MLASCCCPLRTAMPAAAAAAACTLPKQLLLAADAYVLLHACPGRYTHSCRVSAAHLSLGFSSPFTITSSTLVCAASLVCRKSPSPPAATQHDICNYFISSVVAEDLCIQPMGRRNQQWQHGHICSAAGCLDDAVHRGSQNPACTPVVVKTCSALNVALSVSIVSIYPTVREQATEWLPVVFGSCAESSIQTATNC